MATVSYNVTIGHDLKPFELEISNEQRCSFGVITDGQQLVQENFLNLPNKAIYQNKTQNGKTYITTNCNGWAATDVQFDNVLFYRKLKKQYDVQTIKVDGALTTNCDANFIYVNSSDNAIVEYFNEDNVLLATVEQESYPVFIERDQTNLSVIYNLDNKTFTTERSGNRIRINYSLPVLSIVNLKGADCLDIDIQDKEMFWNQAIFYIGNHEYDFFKQKFATRSIAKEIHPISKNQRYIKLDHKNVYPQITFRLINGTEEDEVASVIDEQAIMLNDGIIDLEGYVDYQNVSSNSYIGFYYDYLKSDNHSRTISQLNNSYNKISIILYKNNINYIINKNDEINISSDLTGMVYPPVIQISETGDELEYGYWMGEGYTSVDRRYSFYANVIDDLHSYIIKGLDRAVTDYVGDIYLYASKTEELNLSLFLRCNTVLPNVFEHNVVGKYGNALAIFGDEGTFELPFNADVVNLTKEIELQSNIISSGAISIDISDIEYIRGRTFELVDDRATQYQAIRNYTNSYVCSNTDAEYLTALTLYINEDIYGFDGYIVGNEMILNSEATLNNESIVSVIFKPEITINLEDDNESD